MYTSKQAVFAACVPSIMLQVYVYGIYSCIIAMSRGYGKKTTTRQMLEGHFLSAL